MMGHVHEKQLSKTPEHYIGLSLWSEVLELKQVLVAISRQSPNDDVKTPDDSNTEKDCAR